MITRARAADSEMFRWSRSLYFYHRLWQPLAVLHNKQPQEATDRDLGSDIHRLDQDTEVCKTKHPTYSCTLLLLSSKPNYWLTTVPVPQLRAVHGQRALCPHQATL